MEIEKFNHNTTSLSYIELFGGGCFHALNSEAMSNTEYEEMADIYKQNWLINKLKLLCVCVYSHINNFTPHFIPLSIFT